MLGWSFEVWGTTVAFLSLFYFRVQLYFMIFEFFLLRQIFPIQNFRKGKPRCDRNAITTFL